MGERMLRRALVGSALLMSAALPANAREVYPGGIQKAGNMPCAPSCLLCHTAIPGNPDNLEQLFGKAVLKAGGLRPGDPDSLVAVVASLRTKMSDVDNDGVLDVEELAAGTNPNDPDPTADLCGPTYGCGAHIVQAPPPDGSGVLWCVAGGVSLALVLGARRRRASRR